MPLRERYPRNTGVSLFRWRSRHEGPASEVEWAGAVKVVQTALGLPAKPAFVRDALIDVRPYCAVGCDGNLMKRGHGRTFAGNAEHLDAFASS
jgi:hypothetical protein